MKFILHNLQIIRACFRSNGWVLGELFLVFIVLWFLCDSLGCLKYTFYRPLGMNIEHVYQLYTIEGGESRDTSLTRSDKYLGILKKLQQQPTVEAASLSFWSLPMNGNNAYNSLAAQDTIGIQGRLINATDDYLKVFRIGQEAVHPFERMTSDDYHVMLTEGSVRQFRKKLPVFSMDTPLAWYGDSAHVVVLHGVVNNFRSYRYGEDAECIFLRLDENRIRKDYSDERAQIAFRVKAAADGVDYRTQFLRDIAPKLDMDNMFVADAAPYTDQQLQFEVMRGDTDKVNTQSIVVLFLLVNVFLGLIGTFWFRTRHRRSEIALRLAMGSSKKQIFYLLMGEGLLLLTLVTVPAMIICYQIGISEFTIGRTSLISTWPVDWSILRFLLGALATWILMALMVAVGIWFPARKAMQIQPAEALHEE